MLTVIIPWRPQRSRLDALHALEAWYRINFADVDIRFVDSDDALFNLARCRNLGIAGVTDAKQVVVINDADTVPERAALVEAIAAAATSGLVHLPYTRYHWLGAAGTAELLAGTDPEECSFELVNGACSGVYVTTPESWWSHGGQDERFRGWGFEDAAWYVAHETLLGAPPQRHDGAVYALHHETQLREGPQYDANAALMQRYRDASTDPVVMRQFVLAGSESTTELDAERAAEYALDAPAS